MARSQAKAGGAQHPHCASVPKASSPASWPVGTRSPAGAQVGLGCQAGSPRSHVGIALGQQCCPAPALLEGVNSAAGSMRVCSGCGMPDGFTCLNLLLAAPRTLGSISREGCCASQPPHPIPQLPEPLSSCSFLSLLNQACLLIF